tara:strand:- start:2224 stop:2493 length:270 start_codon:yes stop_codon:yes gene_type:complete
MKTTNIIKLQGIEGTEEYFENFYQSKKLFFFKYKKAFQLMYSNNCGFYLQENKFLRLDKAQTPYTKRGRFVAFNSKNANDLIGREFFLP